MWVWSLVKGSSEWNGNSLSIRWKILWREPGVTRIYTWSAKSHRWQKLNLSIHALLDGGTEPTAGLRWGAGFWEKSWVHHAPWYVTPVCTHQPVAKTVCSIYPCKASVLWESALHPEDTGDAGSYPGPGRPPGAMKWQLTSSVSGRKSHLDLWGRHTVTSTLCLPMRNRYGEWRPQASELENQSPTYVHHPARAPTFTQDCRYGVCLPEQPQQHTDFHLSLLSTSWEHCFDPNSVPFNWPVISWTFQKNLIRFQNISTFHTLIYYLFGTWCVVMIA